MELGYLYATSVANSSVGVAGSVADRLCRDDDAWTVATSVTRRVLCSLARELSKSSEPIPGEERESELS